MNRDYRFSKPRLILKAISLIIIFVMLSNAPFLHSDNSKASAKIIEFQDAGEQLKAMGIVKGYKAYGLAEDKDITEGELLALLSRTLSKSEAVDRRQLVAESNWFDRFVNDAYNAFIALKEKVVEYYYKFLSAFPNYQVLPGIKRDSWFFEDALYLRIRGFKLPEDFSLYKKINEKEFYSMLLEVLSLGEHHESISAVRSISDEEKLEISLAMHGLLPDNLETNETVTRGEVFNIILNVIKE